MRLMIIGTLEGQLILATRLAVKQGAKVLHAADINSAMISLRNGKGADLIMLESKFSAKELKECLDTEKFHIPIVACGISKDQERAVECIKEGAIEYITLPPEEELIAALLTSITNEDNDFKLIYTSAAFQKIIDIAKRIAPSNANVLITGQSGTGKEVIAKFIHLHSKRKERDLISLNCAAIPDNLLESELFGHEKGAFTGAIERRIGKFEEANQGAILLDEISEMELRLQAKLLRAIQEREITRVGGNKPIKLDIRIIATSNKDLLHEVKNGNFREDLFYRLNVIHLKLPDLKDRKEDIVPLTEYFIKKYSKLNDLNIKSISKKTIDKLKNHAWNGNVRELENTIHRAVLLSNSSMIDEYDIQFVENEGKNINIEKLEDIEKRTINNAMAKFNHNYDKAARVLGISIKTLRNKLKAYKITDDS